MIRLFIFKETTVRLPQKRLNKLFEKIMKEEADSENSGRINLVFTTDSKIKKLNKAYRNIDKSTDVLSFNIDNSLRSQTVFGEIYISVPTAKKQAKESEINLNEELLRLSCHGLLHLLGYDHLKRNDQIKMEARESYYMDATMRQ